MVKCLAKQLSRSLYIIGIKLPMETKIFSLNFYHMHCIAHLIKWECKPNARNIIECTFPFYMQ